MAKLKRDQRVCPYCAETIKASAIRCRYCQSDLTPQNESELRKAPEPELAPELAPEPEPKPKQKQKPEQGPKPGPAVEEPAAPPAVKSARSDSSPLYRRLTVVLAVLVALAAVAVGTSWWRAANESAAAAPNGALVGEEARTEVLVAAADLAKRTLSYNYKTLANDMEVARARMTPIFRKEYDATMSQIRDNTAKNKIVLEAAPVSSAIIEATEGRAKVLVFVNQTTSAGDGKDKNQQLNRNSLVVTLTRADGEWVMSKLAALS